MNRSVIAAVGAFFLVATTAFAQEGNRSQITVQGTGLITKDSTSDSTSREATKSGGLLVGYSYQFNRWAGAEGNYGYSRNMQNYFVSFGQSSVQANIHELTGSFVAHIPVNIASVRPYALAGAGALIFDPTDRFLVGRLARH